MSTGVGERVTVFEMLLSDTASVRSRQAVPWGLNASNNPGARVKVLRISDNANQVLHLPRATTRPCHGTIRLTHLTFHVTLGQKRCCEDLPPLPAAYGLHEGRAVELPRASRKPGRGETINANQAF
jgi:hypothetical protein